MAEPTTQFGPSNQFQFTTLTKEQRHELVELTNHKPLDISTLELSALGANVEIAGQWNDPSVSNIVGWHDLGQGGRTVKSVISLRGYLFPLGHRAVMATYFERIFAVSPTGAVPSGLPVAYLQTYKKIRVTEPVKTYGARTPGEPWAVAARGTRDWPFWRVRITTLTSPVLSKSPNVISGIDQAIWPMFSNGTTDVTWTFVATDLAGRDVTFSMPLVFVYGYDPAKSNDGGPYNRRSALLDDDLAPHFSWSPLRGVGSRGCGRLTEKYLASCG